MFGIRIMTQTQQDEKPAVGFCHDTFAKGMLKALPKVKVIMRDGHTMLSS